MASLGRSRGIRVPRPNRVVSGIPTASMAQPTTGRLAVTAMIAAAASTAAATSSTVRSDPACSPLRIADDLWRDGSIAETNLSYLGDLLAVGIHRLHAPSLAFPHQQGSRHRDP